MVQRDGVDSMACIANDPDAERVLMRVEALLVCRRLGNCPEGDLPNWVLGGWYRNERAARESRLGRSKQSGPEAKGNHPSRVLR